MGDAINNEPDFLWQTLLILRALLRRNDNPSIRLAGDRLYLADEELRRPADVLSERELKDRIRELARRAGLPDVSVGSLAEIWRTELAERALSRSELLERGELAILKRNPHETDLVRRWRDELLARMVNQLADLNAVERFDAAATAQDRERKLELGPLVEDWPRRILEDDYWKYAEAPLPEMKPLALDDVWVDLFLSDLLEALEEREVEAYQDWRDERQRWRTEPAAFVLERVYGATALVGPPGCGKTTLLKWFARQLIARPQGRFLLPLYVPLRKYARAHYGAGVPPSLSLLEFALRQCGITQPAQLALWMPTISYLTGADRANVLLMLDGWDEVPAEHREPLLSEIDDLAHAFAIIITSRPSGFPRLLPVSHIYEIASLSPDNSERLIRRWFEAAGAPEQAEAVLRHLDAHPDLQRLARNPFLLSLLCGICRHADATAVSAAISRTALYRQAIQLIVAHHNRHFPRPITASEERKVERLALWLQADAPDAPRYVFDRTDVERCLNETATLDTIRSSRLLSQLHLDRESFHFLHTTFQEYLAARGLLGEPTETVESRLRERAYDLGWQEILCFAAGESADAKSKQNLWQILWRQLAALASQPDRFGLVFVRLARFVGEAGARDGGKQLLGVDVRDELWRAIERGVEINVFVDAFAELDPNDLLRRIEARLGSGPDERVRARLLRVMGRFRSPETARALVDRVLHGDDNAAAIAAYASHRVLDAESFRVLRAAVTDAQFSEQQRIRALRTLGNARDSLVVPPLAELARQSFGPLSIEAIKALGRIGDAAASAALAELLSETSDVVRQEFIITALGQARDPVARDRLIEEITYRWSDDPLLPAALEALVEKPFYNGAETVVGLLRCERLEVRAAAAQALADSARTTYGHELARVAQEDGVKAVRMAALQSLVKQGGPQDVLKLVRLADDEARDVEERAEALATALQICARLTPDGLMLRMLSRTTLDALRTPSGLLAMSAAMHAHMLGDTLAERLLDVCRDDEASDSVREEACSSLARQIGQTRTPHNGDYALRKRAADALLELVRREPATAADEDEPNLDSRQRLAQAAAAALTEINAARLLGEPGTTCAHALAAFSVRTGCLVFPDRIINAGGQTIASQPGRDASTGQTSDGGAERNGHADQASHECLRRVRRSSRIAADDAQQVIQTVGQAVGTEQEVLLGPELYVERDIEQEIRNRLEKSVRNGQPVSILLTGEAGHGKTSLLWRLHQTLGEAGKWEPWFIKSTLLALAPRPGEAAGGIHLNDLLAAAQLARAEGRRPLVLLDTVDALLHGEEAERERVVEALLTLSEEGCGLIAACRPQEAVLLGPLRRGSLRLDEYRGRELTEAIDKHVAHFYAYADLRTREEHRAHINSVVSRGLPLREVCVNPLTLRMLFVLYAPDHVPEEVNVFGLYDKFWRDRVVTDRRAGSPLPQPNAANLEKTAALVALVMLAEGQPELPAQRVRDGVAHCGGDANEITQLVSRGVLQGQGDATLHFFHQTFFEHSAARAILDHFGQDGLSLLQRRLAGRPHDMFLSPIYEQALLLAENESPAVRLRADDLLCKLFQASSAIERSSAAYIYAHRKNVPPATARQFQELLKTSDTALVRRFLSVAPNLPVQRWESLFRELDLIWEREKWDERAHALDLLERLAVRDDRRVLDYLTRHEVLDYILKLPFHFQGATRLLRVHAALAIRQPARSWELVGKLYGFGIKEQSQDLQISAINALAEYAALYGPENIASRFEEMERNTADTPPRFNEAFPQAIGRLWTIEWRARNAPLETVIEAINDPQADEVQTRARLYGLAGLLVDSGSVADAAYLFESFRREADVHRQWLWARMCLPGLLGGGAGDDELSPAVRHVRSEIVAIFRNRIRQAKNATEASPGAHRIFLMAREAVEKANFSPARLAALLDFPEAEAPEVWLDKELLAGLLPDACLGGHGGAIEAMRLLTNAPEQFPEAPVIPIALRLSTLAAEHREAVWQFLALTARAGDAEGAAAMVRTLELLQPPVAEITDNLKASLSAFRQMLIASRSVPAQRTGFALWWHLVRLGVCDPPSLAEIRRQLKEKSDITTRAELVNLLSQAAVKNRLDADEVAAILLPFAALKDQKLGKAALTALVNVIIELPVEAPEFILRALDVALAAPTDSGRPTLFGRVIEFLSARNVALAAEILKRILRAPAIAELGKQAQKDIANRLRSPARQLVRVMTQEQRNQMLALTPAIDQLLQRVIVEAVCHEAFLPSIEALDQLLASAPNTSGQGLADSTIELIRRQKYARERSTGGETWLELYDIVKWGFEANSANKPEIESMNTARIDDELLTLLKRVADGESFLRPANESEDELKSFTSQANALLELRRLGYLEFNDRAVKRSNRTSSRYVTIVGPCRVTYQGEQLIKAMGKSDHGQTQTVTVAKPRLGIVIALGEEFAELFREIEGSFFSDRDPNTGRNYYFFDRASSATGKTYPNVATFVGGMGPTQAALVSQAMMIRYAPQTMVMLGIAGGIDGDVRIGDIIIPTVVDAYLENSKAEKSASGDGFAFVLGGEPFRPSIGWIRLVEHLPFVHKKIFDRWQEECANDWLALMPDATQREELLAKACVREKAGLVTGHLASGPTVGATEKFSEWLKTHRDRKYLGLEMEAAGLMAAANEYLHAKDTLVVRAVSDFGDERKKEMEQKSKGVLRRYAVRNAIRLLWLLVEANDE
jgi:nucleoside phosphorylase/HEAT repeat protein/DNA polymerase III delta prime subunit